MGWGNSPHGNPDGDGSFGGPSGSSSMSGGDSGYAGSHAANMDFALGGLGLIGGLRSGDRTRSGLTGGGGNDIASVVQQAAYGLGMDPNAFWDAFEARYGKPQMPQAQVEEAMTGAEAQRARYGELTNKLLQTFETNWRNIFGGEGEMFPHIEGGTE